MAYFKKRDPDSSREYLAEKLGFMFSILENIMQTERKSLKISDGILNMMKQSIVELVFVHNNSSVERFCPYFVLS